MLNRSPANSNIDEVSREDLAALRYALTAIDAAIPMTAVGSWGVDDLTAAHVILFRSPRAIEAFDFEP